MPKYGDPPFQTPNSAAIAAATTNGNGTNGSGTPTSNGQVHIDEDVDERYVLYVVIYV